MPRAFRPCPTPGCPELIAPGVRRCEDCGREYEARRGTAAQRGYGTEHRKLRAKVARDVIGKPCARCGEVIKAGDEWHLDHDDERTGYLGPSHAYCNVQAAGRAAHR